MRKLAWTNNILHRDAIAWRWFDLARRSPDPTIAADAEKGFRNLRGAARRFRTTAWLFPLFSSRWHDLFVYGQIKTAINLGLLGAPLCQHAICGRHAAHGRGRQSAVSLGKLRSFWRLARPPARGAA